MSPESRRGAGILLFILAALCAVLWLDLSSPLAAALRTGKPVAGLLSLRLNDRKTPAFYAVVYGPSAGTLDLVHLPPSLVVDASSRTLSEAYGRSLAGGKNPKAAVEAAAQAALSALNRQPAWPGRARTPWRIAAKLSSGRIPSPFEVRGTLAAVAADPLFWLHLPRRLRALGADAEGLGPYDAFLLAWRLSRLRPDGISLSRPPAQTPGEDAWGPKRPAKRGKRLFRLVPELFSSILARAEGRKGAPENVQPTAEVVNASGSPNIALKATKILRLQGFDVVNFGNASALQPTVRIVVHSGAPEDAETVIRALGCPESGTLVEFEPDPQTSVTVVLGKDYLRCAQLNETR
ncbi:MAG: LytR C-terminal domain-containing protein [Elusimicrobia bacterium]|nr:LytR C-terminal domain-containing protein [Elusimicrobiota bacterium]